MNVNRQPEGIPVGGQWATGSKSESDVDIDTPVSLSQAIASSEGGVLCIGEFEHGDPAFAEITVEADEGNADRCVVIGEVALDFNEGLESAMEGVDEDDRGDWLTERSLIIDQWLKDEYGVANPTGGYEWDAATAEFMTALPGTAGTDDITEALRDNTQAVKLYEESRTSLSGSRNMWDKLGEHLTEYDKRADEASRNYLVAAVWTGTFEDEEGEIVELDSKYDYTEFSDESVKAAKTQLRNFLFANREAIAQAREIAEARGETYDDAQVGHDLSLTRNHHGVGFWDRGLGEAGEKLTTAAHALGEVDVEVGDDGKLHV